MKYDPARHHRRSIRLRGYDYAQAGAYFVTIVVQNRECLLGDIVDGEMRLNDYGRIVAEEWRKLPAHFPHLTPDLSMVMPNHLHGIIAIMGKGEASAGGIALPVQMQAADASPLQPAGTVPGSLGAIVQNFKSTSTRRVNILRQTPSVPVWQRNYYEHIIRDERELNRIRAYIVNNPLKWALDSEHPDARR